MSFVEFFYDGAPIEICAGFSQVTVSKYDRRVLFLGLERWLCSPPKALFKLEERLWREC
jgi:hypothetical protein